MYIYTVYITCLIIIFVFFCRIYRYVHVRILKNVCTFVAWEVSDSTLGPTWPNQFPLFLGDFIWDHIGDIIEMIYGM